MVKSKTSKGQKMERQEVKDKKEGTTNTSVGLLDFNLLSHRPSVFRLFAHSTFFVFRPFIQATDCNDWLTAMGWIQWLTDLLVEHNDWLTVITDWLRWLTDCDRCVFAMTDCTDIHNWPTAKTDCNGPVHSLTSERYRFIYVTTATGEFLNFCLQHSQH